MATITGVNTKSLKILATVLVAVGIFFGVKHFYLDAPKSVKESQTLKGKVELPDAPDASLSGENAVKLPTPTKKAARVTGARIEWKVMAWNSQMGLMYANGGEETKEGSLIEAANLNVHITRQDDCQKSYQDVIKFSKDYSSDDKTPAVFATFMGDGMPTYMTNISNGVKELGLSDDYQPVIIGTFGQSYGEDQLMAPISWKENPKNALGGVVACVIGDGDMNILLNWAEDNNLKVNPDPKTYDSSAINLMDAGMDFMHAVAMFNTEEEVEVKVAKNGKTTGQLVKVKANAVATWTPGDVAIVEGRRAGLVTIVSTHDYSTQMPNMTVTCKKWAKDHQEEVEKLIVALGKGGDQVRSYSDAKQFAAEVSAIVYADPEKPAKFWAKYYDGVQHDENTHLGGSRVYNLSDMRNTFGLGEDGVDRYGKVYERFAGFLKQLYPELLANCYPYESATKYAKAVLRSIEDNNIDTLALKSESFKIKYAEGKIKDKVSSKNYQIKFGTNSAVIQPSSKSQLNEILTSSVVGEELKIEVYGHTDDVGDADHNRVLSQSRADAVKAYLLSKKVSPDRISNVEGLGEEIPVNCVDKSSGDNPNRRVVNITFGR
jgi:OOP family OmpA-OmpF porin